MAHYLVEDTSLTKVGNAIREKTGYTEPISFPTGFVDMINSIEKTTTTTTKLQVSSLTTKKENNWSGALSYISLPNDMSKFGFALIVFEVTLYGGTKMYGDVGIIKTSSGYEVRWIGGNQSYHSHAGLFSPTDSTHNFKKGTWKLEALTKNDVYTNYKLVFKDSDGNNSKSFRNLGYVKVEVE